MKERFQWMRSPLGGASIFALWALAWMSLPFWLTRSLPGAMSFEGSDGLLEIPRQFLGDGVWLLFIATYFAAFAMAWLFLRVFFNRRSVSVAIDALRWSFTSRSFNLTVIAYFGFLLSLAFMRVHRVGGFEGWWIVTIAAMLPLIIAAWFLVLNPNTMLRPALLAWWRPFWPGVAAFLIGLLLLAVLPRATGLLLDVAADRISGFWWTLAFLADLLIGVAIEVAAMAIWWNRGRWSDVRIGLRNLMSAPVLRAYVAYQLMWLAMFVIAAIPVLVLGLFQLYIVPQYEAWAEIEGRALPQSLATIEMLMQWTQRMEIDYLAPVVAGLFYVLGLGRLLVPRMFVDGNQKQAPVAAG